MSDPHRPRRVAVVGAGGTIAMHGAHAFDWVDYGDTGVIHDIASVLDRAALALPGIETVAVPCKLLPSTGITPQDWVDLAQTLGELAERQPAFDGIVLTHGTASLEETAFFLSLVHRGPPLVLVGAQRPPNTVGSDAVPNLRAAVAAAASPALCEVGVCVAMNGYLFAARDVSKTGNHQLHAFEAAEFGPLGRVEPDASVTLVRSESAGRRLAPPVALRPGVPLPRVDIACSYAGADGAAVAAFVAAGARGIVSAGFPPGRCANGERSALIEAAAAGVTVVQSSRALRGRVPEQAYNRSAGILSGGALSPQKCRILLMVMLAAGCSTEEIQTQLLRA